MRRHQPPPRAAAFAVEEEEEDFMSDKYLLQAEEESKKTKAQVSYTDRRRKELAESSAKARQKSRAQREEEARREGLERDLLASAGNGASSGIDGAPGSQGDNKALKMMLAMGFKPGQELGSKTPASQPTQDVEDRDKTVPLTSSAAQPIAIDSRWQGKVRHGIGSSAVSLAIHRAASEQRQRDASETSAQDLADFRSRVAAEQTQRHVEKLLGKARHTCEELDRKHLNMEYSPLWIDVKWMDLDWETQLGENAREILKNAFGEELEHRQAGLDGDGEEGSKLAGQEAKVRKALEQTAPSKAEEEGEEPPNPRPPPGTILDEEAEAALDSTEAADAPLSSAQEARQFCALEASTRLKLTLDHLRKAHHYCLFCGCQYEDEEDLTNNCPGETEEEHD